MTKRKRSEDVPDGKERGISSKRPRASDSADSNNAQIKTSDDDVNSLARISKVSEQFSQKDREEIKSKKLKLSTGPSWRVSSPTSGRLLDLDPVFSTDEQYVLLAYPESVRVYSCDTSLPVRTLTTRGKGTISSITLSACDSELVYITRASGRIEKWNWQDGMRLSAWDVNSELFALQAAPLDEEKTQDIIYVADRRKNKNNIAAHIFQTQGSDKGAEVRTLLEVQDPVKKLQLKDGGRFIIVALSKSLLIGTRKPSRPSSTLESLNYVWRELAYSASITCLDSYLVSESSGDSKDNKRLQLNVAVGTNEGSIFLYRDIVNQLHKLSKRDQTTQPHVSKHHWHRAAVGSVKWSKDGDYLVSGGSETVLVLWQLDTGKRQNLPHLSSAIENIVVSPTGSSYAIRLADNSVMALSTRDLQPTMNIAGLQISNSFTSNFRAASEDSVTYRSAHNLKRSRGLAITISPESSRIMLATPTTTSSRPETKQSSSAPYLQTIDARNGVQLAKQALCRTNVTDRNVGPDGDVINEPNVVLLKVSRDGKWLASVDEWLPPSKDLGQTAINASESSMKQKMSLETYLKFWSWNADTESWELAWRAESPHKPDVGNAGPSGFILDLAHDPSKDGFFTLGDDGLIRSWYPHSRIRNGQEVKDKQGRVLPTWSSRLIGRVILSEVAKEYSGHGNEVTGRLALSADGSVLAAALCEGSDTAVYIFSLADTQAVPSHIERIRDSLGGIGIVGRHLVFLGDELLVWNLVDDILTFSIELSGSSKSLDTSIHHPHLSVNHQDGTFAMVTWSGKRKRSSKLTIFDPNSPTPKFSTNLPWPIISLLPNFLHKGYTMVDSRSEIRTLAPQAQHLAESREEIVDHSPSFTAVDSLFEAPSAVKNNTQEELDVPSIATGRSSATEVGKLEFPTPDQNGISSLWSTRPAMALPDVSAIFTKVASIISKKATPAA